MSNRLAGIHLANGAQDIGRVLATGAKVFTLLHEQRQYIHDLQVAGAERIAVRYYSPNFLAIPPAELAQRIADLGLPEVIPWNEANLPYEVGEQDQNLMWDSAWNQQIVERVLNYWDDFRREFRQRSRAVLHFPAWSPWDANMWPFGEGADINDVHAYGALGTQAFVLKQARVNARAPLFVSEWNFAQPWSDVSEEDVQAALEGFVKFNLLGATAFIWRWFNPDPNHPNLDLEGTAAERALTAANAGHEPGHEPSGFVPSSRGNEVDNEGDTVAPRPDDIQAIIDFNNGLAERFGRSPGKRLTFNAKDCAAFAVQAKFSKEHLEAAYPLS